MTYETIIKCDNPECNYETRFYTQEMWTRCNDIIKLNLAVPFSFTCKGCHGVVTILRDNVIRNERNFHVVPKRY